VIVVDAANVVGSRPDGWWKDRAGAARRLVAEIAAAVEDGRLEEEVVVVLEGAARDGVGEGPAGDRVEVVHAGGEGDVTIVEVARQALEEGEVVVVTADRVLSSTTSARGASVRGPRWLWEKLDR